MQKDSDSSTTRPPFYESLVLVVPLFAFWVVLSGKFDAFHLGAGLLSSIAIALGSCYLYALDPPLAAPGRYPFAVFPWLRMLAYLPWLTGQIFLSSLQVARLVLSPKLDIRPKLFRFVYPLPNGMARATLANSITLTPGTVTIDLRRDEYVIHALTYEAAASLEGDEPSNMKARVARVFEPKTS